MAKEAIEKVKAAEESAAQIIRTAEQESLQMTAEAAEKAKEALEAEKDNAKKALDNFRAQATLRTQKRLFDAEGDINKECEAVKARIFEKKEDIIGRIIEEVKA